MMGGYPYEEDCELILPRTVVLVGKTGNGKSATGNSILGKQIFPSKRCSSAVTTTCELKTTAIEDGETLNVIDTPGLFESSDDIEVVGKEIFNCINMARNGVDAFLLVISARIRFSNDEKASINRLLNLFGRKIYDYMIIVFTGGDELENDNESLEDFLHDSPKALQETLGLCGNRCVLFDNKTKDPTKRSNQVQKLLSLVDMVSKNNEGKPYTNEMFTEPKKCTQELDEHHISVFNEQFKQLYEMVESKLSETTLRVEQLLAEERTARLKAEENAKIAQKKSDKKKQKKKTRELNKQEILVYCDEQYNRLIEMIELKFNETTLKVEQQLAEEQSARLMTDEIVEVTQKISEKEIMKIDSKLMETSLKLEQLLNEERTARLKAEENAKIAQKKSEEELQKIKSKLKETTLKLKENAKVAQKKSDEEIRKVKSKLKETNSKLKEVLAEKKAKKKSGKETHKEGDLDEKKQVSTLDELLGLIFAYKQAFTHPNYQHIDFNEKQKVLKVCKEAEKWVREKRQVPVLLPSDIKLKACEIHRECRPIMSKPKPAPPK